MKITEQIVCLMQFFQKSSYFLFYLEKSKENWQNENVKMLSPLLIFPVS
jgi:hypothetical protein